MKISRKSILTIALALLMIGGIATFHGCTGPAPVTGNLHVDEARSQKLMALAAEEAGKIGEADMRLTRQLNLSDLQIARGWAADARTTLAAARKTLGSPGGAKLNDHARMSGWVSVSELSRRIDDKAGASLATEAALQVLDGIQDPAKRCEYVMGLSNELQYIKGKPAAAELLAKAGPWTKSIDHLQLRRQALIAFSTALFNFDDFSAGQVMLGQEDDAAWRSDILAGMAQNVPADSGVQLSSGAVAEKRAFAPALASPQADLSGPAVLKNSAGYLSREATSATSQPFFGKSLNYEKVFKNQKSSQTSKD